MVEILDFERVSIYLSTTSGSSGLVNGFETDYANDGTNEGGNGGRNEAINEAINEALNEAVNDTGNCQRRSGATLFRHFTANYN